MFRYAVIAAMAVIIYDCALASAHEELQSVDYYIQSEYRNDAIDYDETEKNFFREKATIHFSEKSNLNLAHVYIDRNDDQRFTWSLVLRDISPTVSCILGYYYVNFGSGLLIGKKTAYNPDVFSQKGRVAANRDFSPCKSGNPTFAFRGLALSYHEGGERVGISINTFYSLKKRYIDEESYEEGATPSDLNAIEYKSDSDYKYHEPVEIRTHGSAIAFDLLRLFNLQIHYIYTDIWSYADREIYWDEKKRGDKESGTSNLIGIGFSIRYCDEFISLFIENDISKRSRPCDSDREMDSLGHGMLYGLAFRHSILAVSLIVKCTGKEYYTPYESSIGSEYPEKGWFLNARLKAGRMTRLGAAVSYERRESTSSRAFEIPLVRKEKVYLNYSSRQIERFTAALRMVEKKEYGDDKNRMQLKSGIEINVLWRCRAIMSVIYQDGSGVDPSKLYTGGVAISFIPWLKSTLSVGRAEISESNSIYAVLAPIRNTNIPGIFIRDKSSLFVMKNDITYKKISFSMRCLYQFAHGRVAQRKLELFGSGYF